MKIFEEVDLLPDFFGEFFNLTEEKIKKLTIDSFQSEENIQEVIFIPRVNIIVATYDNNSKMRIIFLTKELGNYFDIGTLTLENMNNFSFENFSIKELRHEDYNSISEGLGALIQIKVKNDNK